jgi:hypothetical protein
MHKGFCYLVVVMDWAIKYLPGGYPTH